MDLEKKYELIIEGMGLNKDSSLYFLLKIIESMGVGIVLINTNTTVLYVNNMYTKITGIKYEQIAGRKLRDVRPGARLGEVMKSGKSVRNVPRREGEKEYFVDLAPLYIEGKKIGGLTVMKDIEDARMISRQLKYFENKFEQMKTVINEKFSAKYTFDDIIGNSKEMINAINLAKKVSTSDSSILIVGKTGTGKEMFTQAIHNSSNRRNMPFIPINCASIPPNLIESELFGYESGAFTGSKKGGKIGLFKLAEGGTLFLDEIENMSLDLQIKLLRALQEKRIRKVGSVEYTNIDVRIIAATNVDLEDLIKENNFREDLYYRICVFPIYIPELQNRKEDIKLLTNYFVSKHENLKGSYIEISPQVHQLFQNYNWPGNVRELQNVIEYLVNVDDDNLISVDDLPANIKNANQENNQISLKEFVGEYEKKLLLQYLNNYGTSVESKKLIAKKLDISIATLYNKLREYSLIKK